MEPQGWNIPDGRSGILRRQSRKEGGYIPELEEGHGSKVGGERLAQEENLEFKSKPRDL